MIEGENEWILQCDITNGEDRDIKYTIFLTVDGAVRQDNALVQPGKTYTYTHHIYPHQLGEGKVTLALYEEGKAEPVEQATYYISSD